MNVRVVSHRDLVAAQVIESYAERWLSNSGLQKATRLGTWVLDGLQEAGYDVRHPDDPSRPPMRRPIGR